MQAGRQARGIPLLPSPGGERALGAMPGQASNGVHVLRHRECCSSMETGEEPDSETLVRYILDSSMPCTLACWHRGKRVQREREEGEIPTEDKSVNLQAMPHPPAIHTSSASGKGPPSREDLPRCWRHAWLPPAHPHPAGKGRGCVRRQGGEPHRTRHWQGESKTGHALVEWIRQSHSA